MNFDEFSQFLSSPQSYDFIEKIKKKTIPKKRKTVHKHLLNTNILLENDPSKLTMRQRVLRQKFQNKKESMENLDLLSSGLEAKLCNKKIKKRKNQFIIRLPAFTKMRFECGKENILEQDNVLTNSFNTSIVLYSGTQLCLYNIFQCPLIIPEFKLTLEDCDILNCNDLILQSENNEISYNDTCFDLERLSFKNAKNDKLQTMHKTRRILFKDCKKKKNDACLYKTAFYLSKLDNIKTPEKQLVKKCLYYNDILIKTWKRKKCICKVVGEVKWFIEFLEKNKNN